jgi:hypothetical protein
VTRRVCEKSPKRVAQSLFFKNNTLSNTQGKSSTKMWATSVIFKQLPTVKNRSLGEKLAQSGHPVELSFPGTKITQFSLSFCLDLFHSDKTKISFVRFFSAQVKKGESLYFRHN